ncbi:polyprenyl synthetase family protein [Pedobacter sp.]|jgi:geranylgeranyl diphosphate synthase type II|uniref:polyprenyl synthetase family protein n=1 Tax=Pedobacter sp. TaxID=1411316 RepID=UPI002B714872|nr:polyprenyl synthetase family protein [Pedobacter sp.]HWW42828.1 polyprenyl synthetase family protein [Pedobacter sp.]
MHTTSELQEIIEKAIKGLSYSNHPKNLYDPISYIMNLGGKRLRPALVLLAADLFNGSLDEALPAALAIETFHNFTLIHDDIMDNAPLRRGQQTVHEKWGTNNAILSGDVMMVESNKLLTKVKVSVLKEVLDTFNATAQGVCEGQQLDMEFESRNDVSIEEYIDMIRLKTAVLVGGAMKIGAIVGGANEADANLIYDFGENLGIAFQLQDDILDVYGDPEKFGKQVGGDIIANKKTYLLLKLQEIVNTEDAVLLDQQAGNKDTLLKIERVTALYNQYDVKDLAVEQMRNYLDKAFAALSAINVPQHQKEEISGLANELMNRES